MVSGRLGEWRARRWNCGKGKRSKIKTQTGSAKDCEGKYQEKDSNQA
jgi:hypothetical protein